MAKRINSRQKGARGERDFAKFLRQNGFASARRGRQYSGSPESPDVVCKELAHLHFEVKYRENGAIWTWMEQSLEEAGEEQIPVVVWKKSRHPRLTILLTEDFLKLVKGVDTHDYEDRDD